MDTVSFLIKLSIVLAILGAVANLLYFIKIKTMWRWMKLAQFFVLLVSVYIGITTHLYGYPELIVMQATRTLLVLNIVLDSIVSFICTIVHKHYLYRCNPSTES